MPKHFLRDLDRLRRAVRINGSAVEAAVEKSITALMDGELSLAEDVIDGDAKIDERELEIETECLKILALHQPVAQDLRFLITVLKVNNDLERIGDLAGHVAQRAIFLACRNAKPIPEGFQEMSHLTRRMVEECLVALFEPDLEGAKRVLASDDAVDELKRDLTKQLSEAMQADSTTVEVNLCLIAVAHDLERMADMATNIAEDIVFMLEGELIRHAYRREEPS
jgi:phosphate transport system protein